jgi:CheY-like chemotaxis protein
VLWPQLRIVARAGDGVAAPERDRQLPARRRVARHPHAAAERHRGRAPHRRALPRRLHHLVRPARSRAFEAGAIDYVLKPPTAARLMTTVERLKARLQQPPADLRRA